VALLASAGLAIGLALQGNLGHFASGIVILFFQPFTIGHKITVDGHTGKVVEIGLFATVLNTANNQKVIIPNGAVTGNSIINHSSLGVLRGNISIGVAYGSDVAKALEVMVGACQRVPRVLEDPPPSVVFVGFGASSLDFEVRPWTAAADLLDVLHEVRVALYDDLNGAQIEIPFAQIVVHRAP
jgi:small conductance mechanosensitive channel